MKNRTKLILGITLASNVLIAQADNLTVKKDGFYIAANGGYGILGNVNQVAPVVGGVGSGVSYKGQNNFSYGLNIGYQLSQYRVALSYNKLNNEVKIQGSQEKMKDYTIMLRGIYDINLAASNLHPYFGIKLGIYSNDPQRAKGSIQPSLDKSLVFAYGGLLGVKYSFNSHFNLYSEFNHLSTVLIKKENRQYRINYDAIVFGISYKF